MVVSYGQNVARWKHFRFIRLLFRWQGSIYKLIVHEFTIYFTCYMVMNVVHSFILTEEQEKVFSGVCAQLGRMSGYVVASLTFCLGFFIHQIYERYCKLFRKVPWPDGFAFLVSVHVRGGDMEGRLLRRTMVRYVVASIILTWMTFSERMKELFPSLESLIVSGFLTRHEVALLKSKSILQASWRQMVVVSWSAALVKQAKENGRIEDEFACNAIMRELDQIRRNCRQLIQISARPTPLAYFHTVIIGVYSIFSIAAIAGSHRLQTQHLHSELITDPGDVWLLRLVSQLISMLQYTICAGVLAISLALLLPFGKADCNIDVHEIISRHLSLAYLIVDELHWYIPEICDVHNPPVHRDSLFRELRLISSTEQLKRKTAKRPKYILSVAADTKASSSTPPSEASDEMLRMPLTPRGRAGVRNLMHLISFKRIN